jgi:hypothetical protein
MEDGGFLNEPTERRVRRGTRVTVNLPVIVEVISPCENQWMRRIVESPIEALHMPP